MQIFITGATGFVGERLAMYLAQQGHTVHALVRDVEKARKILIHNQIQLFQGDLLELEKIEQAMQNCQQVYHLAAYAKVWDKNPNAFYEMNVTGTTHILEIAQKFSIQKVVVTSTAGVFGASWEEITTEKTIPKIAYTTEYEKTKAIAEQKVAEFVKNGLNAVIVNPTRVYGQGQRTESNAVTKLIDLYRQGKWYFMPGNGKRIGNYVWVDDVVKGHLLAMEKGKMGERYILGGENASYQQFFDTIGELTGKKRTLLMMPLGVMMFVAKIHLFLANNFSKSPLITPGFVKKYNYDWKVSSQKAQTELGYEPVSLKKGIENTLKWLQEER
jgi:nucleoside-diphosphate-sugar epimerase